jgi:hypothetical protein
MKLEAGSLEERVVLAKAELHKAIRKKRLRFVTDFPGQDAVYSAKEAEALRYLDDSTPDPGNYVFLTQEANAVGMTMEELASLWISKGNLWRQAAAAIESARMTAKAEIDSAASVEDVDEAMAKLHAALDKV